MYHDSKGNISNSIVEFSPSTVDNYNSKGTFENKEQIHTFGKPGSEWLGNNIKWDEVKIESKSTSKYSFSDKGNYINVKTSILG